MRPGREKKKVSPWGLRVFQTPLVALCYRMEAVLSMAWKSHLLPIILPDKEADKGL
jgi:hypothetical protein